MANFKINIDTDGISDLFGEFKQEVEQDLMLAVKQLTAQTDAFIMEQAQTLHSTRSTYIDAYTPFQETSNGSGVFVATLEESALFIEDGLPQNFDMKPGLLKNAKTGKGGIRYKVIPFDHSIAPSAQTPRQALITDDIKNALRAQDKIVRNQTGDKSFRHLKPQVDANGNFVAKNIHSNLNLGGRIYGKGNTPVMNGVNIYQKPSASGKSANMSIKTFRTVTSAQTDKWIHPGLEAKKFFDKAYEHALQIWESQMLPEFLRIAQDKWKK